jgi:hypothetical protein
MPERRRAGGAPEAGAPGFDNFALLALAKLAKV